MDPTTTVSRIVLDHPACAAVFQDRHIDFCCNGGVTLEEACATRGLDAGEVAAALAAAAREGSPPPAEDPRELSTAELVSFIVSRHHAYLRDALPFLVTLAAKVAAVHGDRDPLLRDLQAEFAELRETLELHLDQEEETLFREVVAAEPDQAQLRRELTGMREEHREMGAALRRIRALSNDYTPPPWACTSYRTLLTELRHFEDDLRRHVHLENDVLLPRFTPVSCRAA
ncbi:MAG TPA: iron-sulfur cluster repair di-iron protein [Myxococcales bacterium]|nr:iron-sulfur cluster repair di-iron protein [Myxococcales bacterium]